MSFARFTIAAGIALFVVVSYAMISSRWDQLDQENAKLRAMCGVQEARQ
jgi:hypothetical protein